MQISRNPPIHLTYCLNVHPGETWAENLAAIRDKALAVREEAAPGQRFGLGLRLSCRAARDLQDGSARARFRDFLAQHDLYAFTINGFPYGTFHRAAVKENVYKPDWRTPERRDYTNLLADVLSDLLPDGVRGSISTVPGAYREWVTSEEDVRRMAEMLAETALHLARLMERTGKEVSIGLEPEPDCFMETTPQLIHFVNGRLADWGGQHLQRRFGVGGEEAQRMLRRHLGACLDTAHASVQFEHPAASLRQIVEAGVRLSKVQLSSSLRLRPTPEALLRLEDFRDSVYLHQVRTRSGHACMGSHPDLPEALASAPRASDRAAEWRVHFHVPLFLPECEGLESTSDLLLGEFADLLRAGHTEHVEIETYTFDVLPEALRQVDVTESIANEYRWVLRNMFPSAGGGS